MKTNYYLKCKICKVGRVLCRPTKEELKFARREFEAEHKNCKGGEL